MQCAENGDLGIGDYFMDKCVHEEKSLVPYFNTLAYRKGKEIISKPFFTNNREMFKLEQNLHGLEIQPEK